MTNLLEIKNLYIEAHSEEKWQPIVKDISLTLKKGEVLGLIGESGAGKSTIGLAAMGYTRQGCRLASGSINLDGVELMGASDEDLRLVRGSKIAYVAQSAAASFNPSHRIIRQHVEGTGTARYHELYRCTERSHQNLRRLFLPNPEKIGFRYPHELSGGQLQRAMVAMAMACEPQIIVFDEPTTALDVTTQIEVLAAVKEITEKMNKAALYITHDLAVVAQVAHRIMVLRNGGWWKKAKPGVDQKTQKSLYPGAAQCQVSARGKERIRENWMSFLLSKCGRHLYRRRKCPGGYQPDRAKGQNRCPGGGIRLREKHPGPGDHRIAACHSWRDQISRRRALPGSGNRSKDNLRRLQMIYQMPDTALNPRQTVRKVIGRPLQFYFGMHGKKAEQRIRELLTSIELDPDSYIDRQTTELSGGEKQRICIARALAAEPDLIICDEVTSALDQLVGEGILDLLQDLQNTTNISYLFITHDLATVKAIADKIVIMLEGKIIEQGKKKEILSPPHHEYTDKLLASIPEMDPDWLDDLLAERASIFMEEQPAQ